MVEEVKGLIVTDFNVVTQEDRKRWEKADEVVLEEYMVTQDAAVAITDKGYRLMIRDFNCDCGVYGATCLCRDFIFRRRLERVPAKPCKHLYCLYQVFERERDRSGEAVIATPNARLRAMLEILKGGDIP